MFDDVTPFKAFLGFLAALGVLAAGFGFYGAFLALSGGVGDTTDPQVVVLGDAACTDGEVDALEAPYARSGTVTYSPPTLSVERADVSETETGFLLNATIDGRPVEAGALSADRAEIPVTVNGSDRTVSLRADTEQPVRVWIDLNRDQETVWTDLRICPES